MKQLYCNILLVSCWYWLVGCSSPAEEHPRQRSSFNNGWRFHLGEVSAASQPEFDDASWRTLNLPHDWAIESSFSKKHPSGTGGGALAGGIGWYRKSFDFTAAMQNRKVFVDFDGVYMNATVYINGISLGTRPYGYISFQHDLTPYLHSGRNVLAVRVDNKEQPNSRWYSGCGIYRNVWLTVTHPVHIDQWGVFVRTDLNGAAGKQVTAEVTLKNEQEQEAEIELISTLYDPNGVQVSKNTLPLRLPAQSTLVQTQQLAAGNHPHLWSIESPSLYRLHTEVRMNGKPIDHEDTSVGIRDFRFTADRGFFLNDKSIKIKGVCQHHDLGCLGAAVNVRAMERQLQMLKEMGCNGIRCSHNPPAPELLDLCDRMGFIVMNETFDMWRKRKTSHDYSRYFNEWYERDLEDHIRRDRNHPSVFLWSVGNEVLEQWTDVQADTLDVAAANLILNAKRKVESLNYTGQGLSFNSALTQKIVELTKRLDPTRPTTAGCNEPNPNNHLFRANCLDVIGYNYHETWVKDIPTNFPGKPFLFTETTSALMTRGYYRMPSDSLFAWPMRWDVAFHDPSFQCSSYDNCHTPWGSTHEEVWRLTRNLPFVSGLYVWTGFDYLGEPTPYGWPARSSYFGIIDLAGFPKDIYYMYQSEWTNKPVLHLFPHWNWKPGQIVDLWCYYGQADEVELFINNRSEGVRKKEAKSMHVFWRVPFEPGTVKVVSRRLGSIVAEQEIHTAGVPAQIRLTPDRNVITANGQDLSFITAEVLDKDGNLCPLADNLIHFTVNGNAFIAGVDNGSQTSLESFRNPFHRAFYGKCLVILQNNGEMGNALLTATSNGLLTGTTHIKADKTKTLSQIK